MSEAMPLVISLLAHEEPATLFGQLRNIRHFNPGARVLVHVNPSLRTMLGEGGLQALAVEPGVAINPESLETGWAHIFHAHLSNLRLLRASGLDFGHAVLLSSGDLFFRTGLSAHVGTFDAAASQTFDDAAWSEGHPFRARLEADPLAQAARARTPDGRWRHSMHEGSAYRRSVLLDLLAMVDAIGQDWTDSPGYPREEIILPTLLAARPGRRLTRPIAQTLGTDEQRPGWQRQVAAMAVRATVPAAELARPWQAPLADWLAENAPDGPLPMVYAVARVPRAPRNALRRLLQRPVLGTSQPLPPVEPRDLVELDLPGRTNRDRHLRPLSRATAEAILARAQPLNWLAALQLATPATEIPACPAAYSPEIGGLLRVAGTAARRAEPFLAGHRLAAPLPVGLGAAEGVLNLFWHPPSNTGGRVLLGLVLPEAVDGADYLLLGLGDALPGPVGLGAPDDIEPWLEEHGANPETGAFAKWTGRIVPICLQRQAGEGLWLVPWSFAFPRRGRRILYLAIPARLGGLRLTLLSWLTGRSATA